MIDPESQFLVTFEELVERCQLLNFITRDIGLQKEACQLLQKKLVEIAHEKEQARIRGEEEYANVLLGCKCVVTALLAGISMWLLLKEGRPDDAWDRLVDAQQNFLDATKAHRGFENVAHHLDHMNAIEKVIFPPQVFLSAGMIVESQTCTICGNEYESCDHVKGRPYMGEFCRVRINPSQVDHVAVVQNPANKKCRITKFRVNGGQRNRMTWKIEADEDDPEATADSEERTARAIIATPSTFTEG